MLRKMKIPIIVIVIVLLNQAAGYAVHAAMPDAFRPAGTTRYAVVSASDEVSTSSYGWVNIPGLSQSITIPSGKRGDIMILFCGVIKVSTSPMNQWVSAQVGGSRATPSAVLLETTALARESRCSNFYKLNVAAGTKTVRMQWSIDSPAATQYLTERSMIVIVNIHD